MNNFFNSCNLFILKNNINITNSLKLQIYVIDSADRRRMEETGVELQQLLDEVQYVCFLSSFFLLKAIPAGWRANYWVCLLSVA